MTELTQPSLRTTAVAYEPPFGDALMGRLSAGDVPEGLPLLRVDDPPAFDDPPHLRRRELAAALRDSHRRLGVDPPEDRLADLEAGAWLVVTGQQPGLLTGPGYAIFKALSAVQLARQLSEAWGRTVLPAFWIGSEDHDLLEVNHAYAGGGRFDASREHLGRPVEWISLESDRTALLRFCREQLADLPHGPEAIEWVEQTSFENYPSHFAQLLSRLLGEHRVILVNPMHLRQTMAPAMADMLRHADRFTEAFTAGGEALRAAGVEPQLDAVSMFRFDGDRRVRCPITDDLPERVVDRPGDYSPGAALRPIVQDAFLPVVCTIGGPAEMRYLWQIDRLYAAAEVGRSRLWPRISVSAIDAAAGRLAGGLELTPADLVRLPQIVRDFDPLARLDLNDHHDLQAVEGFSRQLTDQMRRLTPAGDEAIDRQARAAADHATAAMRHAAHQRLAQAGRGKERYVDLRDRLFPGGAPAERRECGLAFHARFGRALIDEVARGIDVLTVAHHVIRFNNDEGVQRGG